MDEKAVMTKLPPKEIIYFDIETTVRELCTTILGHYLEKAKSNEDRCREIFLQN